MLSKYIDRKTSCQLCLFRTAACLLGYISQRNPSTFVLCAPLFPCIGDGGGSGGVRCISLSGSDPKEEGGVGGTYHCQGQIQKGGGGKHILSAICTEI